MDRMMLSLLVVAVMLHAGEGKKVLMLPFCTGSHIMEHMTVAEELMVSGHQVHMILQDSFSEVREKVVDKGVKVWMSEDPGGYLDKHVNSMQGDVFSDDYDPLESGPGMILGQRQVCAALLKNTILMERLRTEKFDLAVVDGFVFTPCSYIVPYNLSVPYVFMFSGLPDLELGIPNLPSFSVSVFNDYSPTSLTLVQKLSSVKTYLTFWFLRNFLIDVDQELLDRYASGMTSVYDVMRKAELFIGTRDHVLEWPSVSLPNVIRTPGLTIRESRPLSGEVGKIVDADQRGIILLSFGSVISDLPPAKFEKFLRAFAQVPFTVLFRVSKNLLSYNPEKIPENVKLLSWIPQQDLLASPKTKLFITHCGNNGQYESVYHGVPMLGFPMFAEQPHNCIRIQEKGLGLCMDVKHFTSEELADSIMEITGNPSYKATAERLGDIIKAGKLPKRTIVDNLELIMKFGGSHLRGKTHDMSLFELFMGDVLITILVIIFACLAVIYLLIRTVYNCLCKRSDKQKKS